MTQPTIIFKKLHEQAITPQYQTAGAAGMDLHADVPQTFRLYPGQRALVHTGIAIEIPEGFEGQVRSRSGMARQHGIAVLNSPGTIDSDYRAEICVVLINTSTHHAYDVQSGDRIAQLVIAPVARCVIQVAEELSCTERATGGFGSTGR